jgi:hypothetical protein
MRSSQNTMKVQHDEKFLQQINRKAKGRDHLGDREEGTYKREMDPDEMWHDEVHWIRVAQAMTQYPTQ